MPRQRTGDDPRRACLANLDGRVREDGSPILNILVACEGSSADLGNRIDVLRGDPAERLRALTAGVPAVPVPPGRPQRPVRRVPHRR